MKTTIPTLLGLASLATAQISNSTDCVSSYVQCGELGGEDNTCEVRRNLLLFLCRKEPIPREALRNIAMAERTISLKNKTLSLSSPRHSLRTILHGSILIRLIVA